MRQMIRILSCCLSGCVLIGFEPPFCWFAWSGWIRLGGLTELGSVVYLSLGSWELGVQLMLFICYVDVYDQERCWDEAGGWKSFQ